MFCHYEKLGLKWILDISTESCIYEIPFLFLRSCVSMSNSEMLNSSGLVINTGNIVLFPHDIIFAFPTGYSVSHWLRKAYHLHEEKRRYNKFSQC